jgi:ABC-2 type transport system permease protein
MSFSWTRVGAILRKELRDYRRNRFVIVTMTMVPVVFGIFLAATALFAHPVIASAIYAGPHVLVQLLFTPLLACWAIWVGIAVSARSTDVSVAQQLGTFASLPPLAILALMSLNVITESTALAIGLAAALLAFDLLAWRVVAAVFDRERLVTGTCG